MIPVKVEIYHASKFGNGAKVAEELARIMQAKGHQVNVHHIDDAAPKEMPPADLYVFGSPTRFGGPIGSMKRFTKKLILPSGAKYAVFATHGAAVPDKKTGHIPTDAEMDRLRQTIPTLDELLKGKGLAKVAERKFFVSSEEIKGHLKDGWQADVDEFAKAILG